MQHYAAFHLDLQCLPKYPFKGFKITKGEREAFGQLRKVTKSSELVPIFSGQGLDSVLVKIGEKLIERFQVPWVENEIISFDNTIKVNANSKRQDSNCAC